MRLKFSLIYSFWLLSNSIAFLIIIKRLAYLRSDPFSSTAQLCRERLERTRPRDAGPAL
jgi:hypothetical protein